MRIAHISDVHIRNLKMHDEYRNVFEDLYSKLRVIKPDLIVNTGDSAHTKTQISPEFVQMMSEHIMSVCEIAPYHIILGNHDMNLMNLDRQDAITPIVKSVSRSTKHPVVLHKKSGLYQLNDKFNFWVYSLADEENYPNLSEALSQGELDNWINIGLFHGSVSNCKTDQDWEMTSAEHDLSIFNGLDFVMMGDIHKRQSFNDCRIWYPGSLIQQNFGEESDKGFLVWDIESKHKFTVNYQSLSGSRGFYTVRLTDNLQIIEQDIPVGARLRVMAPRSITLAEQKEIEMRVRMKFDPYDVVSVTSPDTSYGIMPLTQKSDIENVRSGDVQEKLLRMFYENRNLDEDLVDSIVALDRKFQIEIQKTDDVGRNVSWKINSIAWRNLFNYGEGNIIDFNSFSGVTGIFAPNASGKSSIIDIILESLFDKVTKDIGKNIELINDNRDSATMLVDLSVGEENILVERSIEKIKYAKRSEQKEWGKTSLDLYRLDESGERISLNGDLRPETERTLRSKIGTFEDFTLANVSSQNPIIGIPGGADLINCKETDRKKILYRFLDLDIFEAKYRLANDEAKAHFSVLNSFDKEKLDQKYTELSENVRNLSTSELTNLSQILENESNLTLIEETIKSKLMNLKNRTVDPDSSIEQLTVSITMAETSLESSKKKIQKLTDDLETLGEIEPITDQEEFAGKTLSDLRDAITSIRSGITKLNERKKTISKNIKILDEVPCGDRFPDCKFIKNAFMDMKSQSSVDLEIEKLSAELAVLNHEQFLFDEWTKRESARMAVIQRNNSRLSLRNDIERQKERVSFSEHSIQELNKKLQDALRDSENILADKDILVEVDLLETKAKQIRGYISAGNKQSIENNRLISSLEEKISEVQKMLAAHDEARKTCDVYEQYLDAVGKDGIPYMILTEKIPLINDEINKILSNVSTFRIILDHVKEDQSIGLHLQYGDYRSRNVALGSGAEKFIASLAVRVALSNVSSLPKCNMFVVDEGFGKLDPANLESIYLMFDYLRTVFDHVIVISHVDSLKDIVDNHIDILNDKDGYAHVEMTR